ncbi:hypothetical protein JCM3775_000653 [Rhodotorula graminis]|uniref:Methyltransferase domain-containing protein n=1 Tax=Rhodotorula graminis (strain WP1) TaxID=578459 RepID=A0A194SAR9_RHOGW|nr:uncharacterized protein RHOBADRAFT_42832 [Rhodotorula graminis WP1]KPV76491.1 hypothetical protein RHOBADRAFT_42832 [Rhodotorula graminis WP1]
MSTHDDTIKTPAFDTFGNDELAAMEGITGPPADQLVRLCGILDAVAAEPGTELAVLENAAGAGILTLKLKAQLPGDAKVKVVAGDVERTMIDLATLRFKTAGLDGVRAQVIDGTAIPFADDSFDYSFIHFGIQLYPDPAKGLSESLRILRRGGTLALTTWHTPGFLPLLQQADPSFPTPPPMRHPLALRSTAASVLVDAGCAPDSVAIEDVCVRVPFEGVDAFFELMRKGMKGLVTDEERNGRMRRVIEETYGDGPFALEWLGLAIVGRKA